MKLKSAPGLDQIDYIISNLPSEYTQLLQLYNNILYNKEGVFPTQWKQSLMALIPKFGGSGIRPISLLFCFLKIMERMVYTLVFNDLLNLVIFFQTHNCFRPDRSCIDSLVIMTSDISIGSL